MPLNSRSKSSDRKKKKVETTAPVNAQRQLETTVHTSLPPLVKGSLRGHLVVSLEGGIVWEYSVGPPTPKLCVQLKWWGEKSPGTTFRVPVQVGSGYKSHLGDSTSLAYFPIRSALSQLSAYLTDMGSLTFQVGLGHMTDSSMVIGQAVVPSLKQLTSNSPLKGRYPIVNSSGVHLGRLCVDIRIKTAAQPKEEPTLKKVTLAPPEFIVGPGVRFSERRVHDRSSFNLSNEDIGTMVGDQNKIVSGRTKRSALKEINIPTGGRAIEMEQSVPERAGLGAQQLEVVSELLERGQQLRSKMVESIINQRTNREESPPDRKQELYDGGDDLELYGVGVDMSSEEEDELNILSDVSLDESDYPLHNEVLLSALYLDHPPTSGVASEQERGGLVSLQAGQKDLQTEEKSVEAGEKSEQRVVVDVGENVPLIPSKNEVFKLSSKLTQEEQSVTDTALPSGTQGGSGPENVCHIGSVTSDHSQERSKEKVDSLTALSSYFIKGQSSVEAAIVSTIGLEKLTQLGRVGSARITVGSLQVEPSFAREILTRQQEKKRTGKAGTGLPLPINSTKGPTYFVEYQFPAILHQPGARAAGRRKLPGSHELMRIASKKMKDGVVKFNHHSVFPLEFNSTVILHWWNSALIFRVYCRPPSQRMPFLVGKAVLPLKRILSAKSPCNGHYQLEIRTSTLADAVRERETDDTVVGSLEISLELVQSGKRDFPSRLGGAKEVVQSVPEYNDEELQPTSGSDAQEEVDIREQNSPIHFKEKDINTREVSAKPPALQLLLLIPEAIDVSTLSPPPLPSLPAGHGDGHHSLSLPNCYLVCKLFCAKPHPQTPVQWASSSPQFGIKQLFPLYLTPALLKQVNNNFTVVEVWHRTPGSNTDDELIGLVKLSLHQFYLAFSDEDSVQLCCQAELPVVAVDSYCPIVNPFSGHITGHLAVLMALGTATQISHLQQQYASGRYTLQPPHRAPIEARKTQRHLTSAKPNSRAPPEVVDDVHNEGAVEHVFKLCIEGVRDVSAFASTVWGEADCFVQYHFPTLTSDEDKMAGEVEVSLHPYRTVTTLCVPNPSFSHETHHPLLLESGEPVQKYLMAACGGGLGGGVPFELWRRYYYPNIRDQLVARASLPVAKLCALVTMQGPRGAGGSNIQDFTLPLKLVADSKGSTDSNGVLDVSVKYEAVHLSGGKSKEDSQHVNITVSILRAAGLKDAAGLVAPDNPIALGLAAEVGVNAYATITLPGILKEKRTTKTIARSFSPEFSHLFDLALPFTSQSTKHSGTSTTTLAQKLAEGYILVEMWHQTPKKSSPSSLRGAWPSATAESSGVVTGRRLIPGTKDVLLGRAKVPLVQLLQKSTGIHGWFVLESPVAAALSLNSPKSYESGDSSIAGGVEISVAFTNEEIRDLVVSSGLRHGWRLPDAGFFPGATPQLQLPLTTNRGLGSTRKEIEKPCFDGKNIRFEISISHASLWLSAVDIPTASQPTHKYCFLRYRFFDKKAVVTSPKAITCSREGIATYQLNHRAQLHLTGSAQLQWYLSEESLEVQVWVSLTKRKLSEGPRPLAEDTLLGSAYVALNDIIHRENISGAFPLFKAGVDSLGVQSVHVEIHRMFLSNEATPHPPDTLAHQDSCIEVLDSSDDEDGSPLKSTEAGKKDSDSEEGEEKHKSSKKSTTAEEVEDEETVQDTFSAHIVIHQALHLPELGVGCGEVSAPSPYVTAHPHPNVQRITTVTVAGSRAPVWEHQCSTRIPNHYLQPQSQGLEFQVWSKNSSKPEKEQQDGYIGGVLVDLCPLTCGLSHICGWYDITDFGGQTRGQLKISIAPTQRISYPSPLLAYSTLVTAASSFRYRDTPLVSSAPLVGGDGPSELSTERLLTNNAGAVGENIDRLSSQTRSMLFQQLREDILELDSIHKHLLTKLCQRDSPNHSNQFISSHPHQVQLPPKETTVLRTSGMGLMDEAPPTLLHNRPSILEDFSQGRAHSIGLQSSSPPQHIHRDPNKTLETALSEKSSPSPSLLPSDSSTQSEDANTAVSQQSLPSPRELSSRGLIEDSERQQVSPEGTPTPLTGSRSGSLTDVSMCSKDSSVIVQSYDVGTQSTSQQQMETDTPGKSDEDEKSSSDSESTSECSSTCSSPQPLEDEVADNIDTSERFPTSPTHASTTRTSTSSHRATTAPLDTPINVTAAIPSIPHHMQQRSPHHSASTQEKSPFHSQKSNKDCPTLSSELPSTSTHTLPPPPPPPLPTFRLPNFFMTPQQLEESMRSLRAGALSSRPPPRTHPHYPPSTTTVSCAQAQCHHITAGSSVANHLKTLQEVRAYLESRRTAADRPQAQEISAVETQRLARIFSS